MSAKFFLKDGDIVFCSCAHCNPRPPLKRTMVLCETCGNKRCPHATWHIYKCTGSNEPGQPGSDYA